MKIIMRLVAVVFAVALSAFPVAAQTSSATLSGHVVDQSRGAVPNAEVKLIDEQTRALIFYGPDERERRFQLRKRRSRHVHRGGFGRRIQRAPEDRSGSLRRSEP